jgi:hypothetical protein
MPSLVPALIAIEWSSNRISPALKQQSLSGAIPPKPESRYLQRLHSSQTGRLKRLAGAI